MSEKKKKEWAVVGEEANGAGFGLFDTQQEAEDRAVDLRAMRHNEVEFYVAKVQ